MNVLLMLTFDIYLENKLFSAKSCRGMLMK